MPKTPLLCLLLATFRTPLGAQIVINEIHYAPADRTVQEEFVELYNGSDAPVDIAGWYFSDGIGFAFEAPAVIPARGYLVVAQDPATLVSLYGAMDARGPFSGRLDNQGEEIILRSEGGFREDWVDYGERFPWPVVGGDDGYSIELLHPDLDNDLGASWRPSAPGLVASSHLVSDGSLWRYRKGTSEATSPVDAWRAAAFDDSGWAEGVAPIGYGEAFIRTTLDDMQGNYSSVFLRRTFEVPDVAVVGRLTLEVQRDDGFNAWINGVHVAGDNVASQEMDFDDVADRALEELDFAAFSLPPPAGYLVQGTNVLAIQLFNSGLSNSSDAFIDARLTTGSGGAGPTPGAPNSVLTTEIPPHLRQVAHLPEMPATGGLVLVTAKATDDDGVAEVFLEYQLVDPGAYIRLSDPDYQTQWARIDMNDAGLEGDAEASDDIFTALMPEALQVHRRLVRYRITAVDARGHSVTAPFPEDPQPNFAYFVYDGAPSWQGSARPGVLPVQTYGPALLESIPVYHFLTRREDRLNAIHVPYRWGASGQMTPTGGEYWGSDYLWQGTLVYDGRVYDHIRYRARGGVWRYSMGKNMWKFDFNRGHSFEARDDYGRRYDADWDKLNFSAIIQQGNFLQRGEQGLFEGAGFRLHNLVGNATSLTHFVHFRLIEAADENGPDQYSGDFQGLYLVLEQLDGRFLDQHRLPDGNLYKMEGGTGELNNQGPDQPKDKSDLNSFMSTYQSTSPAIQWWRDNLDLEDYYGFRAIATVIHDYDIHAGKNYFYFNNPVTRKWQVFNWDLDLTWTTTYGGGGLTGPLSPYTIDRFPELMLEYRNRMREIRDLLFNPEQTGMLLDEVAGVVYRAGELSFVDADRAMWDYNPILVSSYVRSDKAGHGKYYEAAPGRTFASMLQYQKSYVTSRGSWLDSNIANDSSIPQRPSVTFQGATGFPIDDLRFRASAFSDPQGSGTFGAMKWRLAEVTPPGAPPFDPLHPKKYEIEADWESDVLTVYERDIQIPREVPVIGRTYRVRVRMMDSTNRWSRWSDPVEFVAGAPLEPFPAESHLRITEVMYHPSQGADYEFVELQNIGPEAIDLSSVAFTEGIEFEFSGGAVTELGPGEFVLVVENEAVFRSTYDAADLLIAGEYSGRLANEGERIALVAGASSTVLDFTFSDDWYPATDGGGYSLVSADPLDAPEVWGLAIGWRESSEVGGSPGWADGSTPPGGRQRPGDGNQDGEVDLSDAIALLLHLFRGGRPLPCEGGSISEGGNLQLFDVNGDARVDVSDAIFTLQYVFLDGAPPALGTACVRIEGCPSACF